MSDLPISQEMSTAKYRFGFDLMGPILAECCLALYTHLDETADNRCSRALYCARGGLTIRRALERFLERLEKTPPVTGKEFMVSRLAASRLALEVNPEKAAPLLALEFEGRSCAAVASVLSGFTVPSCGAWALPYRFERLSKLMSADPLGRQAREAMIEQASSLRAHLASISGDAQVLHIVDTGVFGSIAHYLTLGLPDKVLRSILLFRANYKRLRGPAFPPAAGLVCDQDHYCPWKPRTVSRLYWPFIEAFFEPELPSVRNYERVANGEVISNLQQSNWQARMSTDGNPIKAGAFDYLSTLNPTTAQTIVEQSTDAWRAFRKHIVYPEAKDVVLLGVAHRGVDFGFNDLVSFGATDSNTGALSRIAQVRASIWPEGEIRRLFPKTAAVWLHLLEASRVVTSLHRPLMVTRRE